MTKINIEKEPWLAVSLSKFFMGAGQIYAGKLIKGCSLIFTEIILLCSILWIIFSQNGNIKMGLGLFLIFKAVGIWNLFDAYKSTQKTNSETFENSRKNNKDPWLSVFLSNIVPGLGHFYIKKWPLGILFIVLTIFLSFTQNASYLLFIFLGSIFNFFVSFNAYMLSPVKREISKKVLIFLILIFSIANLQALFFATLIKNNFVEATLIYGAAMEPTLYAEDRVFVKKTKYIPKRGDIVVFHQPTTGGKDFIKRIIAVENETIEIKNKNVYIDGNLLDESYKTCIDTKVESSSASPRDNYGPLKIPAGMVFVIGDYRDKSYDSRYFGPVLQSDIRGKAYKIYWPLKRIGSI